MSAWVEWASWGVFGGTMLGLGAVRRHAGKMPLLSVDVPESQASVCLCMPARNEAEEIRAALSSWIAQDHRALRILVIDDGSTDGTPEILAELAAAHPDRLRVIRNDALPPGWLGKNHALHLAVQEPEARDAAWLLFVDADVQAGPDLLRRALAFAERQPTDILALLFTVDTVSFWERVSLPAMIAGALGLIPPHQVPNPRHWAFAGIGAFTLVRREAYEAVGGHAAAPLEMVDDMMLARRVKKAGFVNRLAQGGPSLHLRVYHGFADLARGMRKNTAAFPGWWLVPLILPALMAVYLAPLWLPFAGHPALAILMWLLVPVVAGDANQRLSGQPMDPVWALWPANALLLATGVGWAFWDRLRGINTWRGRAVRLS
ncbi:MAG TPA: glycosyltransferase family 2 protein [Holophagaceae bacterium]|nr:glycosyltransferase family 2 protein [Holophagaceae bacterium]